jgi:cellulose synthase/poly-beta-1,6-N-acetylglucosamine synthase-like glycosyltransferase
MISVLITSYHEAATIGRALDAFVAQVPAGSEILVICPDAETTSVVDRYSRRCSLVRHIADPGEGKPTAVNCGLGAAQGEIVVLSDGDVVIGEASLEPLLAPFADVAVGAVTGRPVSADVRTSLLGYWSHLLTDSAHAVRLARDRAGQFVLCSGYLFAFRRKLVAAVPPDALAEDAVISLEIARAGYRVRYAPEARVYVRYPATYRDWLRQKVRSTGGYAQDYIRKSPFSMRSAQLEVAHGTRLALSYPRSARELAWTLLLFAARLHLWLLVLWNVRLRRRPLKALWQRVETTKG